MRLPECLYCAKPMPINAKGRPRKYCSDRCRQREWRITHPDKVARRRRWREGKRLAAAAKKKWGSNLNPMLLVRISMGQRVPYCKECGKPYYVPQGGYDPDYKYCSEQCENRARYYIRKISDAFYKRGTKSNTATNIAIARGERLPFCAYCKGPFKPPARGRRPKYCSTSCRQKAHYHRTHKRIARIAQCLECGTDYPLYQRQSHRFCTRRCYDRAYRRRGKRLTKHCHFCNNEFPNAHRLRKYCSDRCLDAASRRRHFEKPIRPTHCQQCGTRLNIPDPPPKALRRFCSQACVQRAYKQRRAAKPADHTPICLMCSTPLVPPQIKYCSRTCLQRHFKLRHARS